jgi:metallo-beta-lactamase family protein
VADGRTQQLIWMLRKLEAEGRIPELPVFLDSPMAKEAGTIYESHTEEHDPQMRFAFEGRTVVRAKRRPSRASV